MSFNELTFSPNLIMTGWVNKLVWCSHFKSHFLGHGIRRCPKKCWKICKPKFCTRRVCKQYKCGYRAVCHRVTRYRIVKRSYKDNVGGTYIIKYRTSKVPYSVNVCKNIPKYCTRCRVQKYSCGKQCRKVCKQVKVRLFISAWFYM